MNRKNRDILKILKKTYPSARSELRFRNRYQLLVAVMLSAQCTDKIVNSVTPALFDKFPTIRSLALAKVSDIEKIIRPVNYYKTKAKNIKRSAVIILKKFHGRVPTDYEDLITLPGVGRKTANVIIAETGKGIALPVDTHVFRVARRLGLSNGKTRLEVEKDLCKIFPPNSWRQVHHALILHGRRICKARNPLCNQCPLATHNLCAYAKIHTSSQ